jgi:GT2 family glycosyltransferase
LINRCLESLQNENAEKIVVSSSPKDITETSATIYNAEFNNPAYKRNKGAAIAKNKYLCFLDDDIETNPYCIKMMEWYLDTYEDIGMVYATLYKMDNHSVIDTSGSFLTWNGFLYETYTSRIAPSYILSGKSACCMIRKDLFSEIGGFDEDFVMYAEETDLSWRVWLAGYKVKVLPSAFAYHAFETVYKPKSYYNQYYIHYHGCKNYITMLIKCLPAHKLYIVILNASVWFLLGTLMFFRNKNATKWIYQGLWYNVRNIRTIWKKRKAIKRKRNDFFRYICKNPSPLYYLKRCYEYLNHQLHG